MSFDAAGQDGKDLGTNGDGSKIEGAGRKRWSNSYAAEESIFYRLAKHISIGLGPQNTQEAVELLLVSIRWMETVTLAQQGAQQLLGLASSHNQEMNAQAIALATLIVAVVENVQVQHAVRKERAPSGTGKELSRVLDDFTPLFLQSSPQSAERLALFRSQTLPSIEPVEKKTKEITASGEIDALIGEGLGIESIVVPEMPVLNSRAGLYIYLNSLVCFLHSSFFLVLTN